MFPVHAFARHEGSIQYEFASSKFRKVSITMIREKSPQSIQKMRVSSSPDFGPLFCKGPRPCWRQKGEMGARIPQVSVSRNQTSSRIVKVNRAIVEKIFHPNGSVR